MKSLFSLTVFIKFVLILLIFPNGSLGNLGSNVSFCGGRSDGGSGSFQIPGSEAGLDRVPISLSEVCQRLVIKCTYVADTTRNLKSLYAANKIEDPSLLAALATTSRLTGFPPNPSEGMLNETLLNNFNDQQKILAFLRLAKKNELSSAYKRSISTIMNQVKGNLCELSVLLKSRHIPAERIRVQMPNNYKIMSQTSRYSWIYVLLRDVLEFFEGSTTLFTSYS
ncbi:uncharacterized protein LOC110447334 [Mizuhopecten yessoensis]|uniref:uncharacterized protein LOC110447334 n=1 Tax=Mizuhopecten yessoensis TaxID=6573 RepID=UPI000B45F569|nr:uncharacterized protein LOC110447334 [Mizuhopecten yessoensis]